MSVPKLLKDEKGDPFDELRMRYADSIWLRSELTFVIGPLRNNFDPPPEPDRLLMLRPEPPKYRIWITTKSGKRYPVDTWGEVHVALVDTGQHILIFRTIFGENLVPFVIVTERTEWRPWSRTPLPLPP